MKVKKGDVLVSQKMHRTINIVEVLGDIVFYIEDLMYVNKHFQGYLPKPEIETSMNLKFYGYKISKKK